MSVTPVVVSLLEAAAQPARAEAERRYLKSSRDFLGVGVPGCRRTARTVIKSCELLDQKAILEAAADLWDGPFFECRRVAIHLLCIGRNRLDSNDLVLHDGLTRYVAEGETWALVDELADQCVGWLYMRNPAGVGPLLETWSHHEVMWLRRASVLGLKMDLKSDDRSWDVFVSRSARMLGEREFFIRKVIGWVLREVSRTRPDLVATYVDTYRSEMSGVTLREAVKYL